MLGTIVNTVAIIAGSIAGVLFRKGIPDRHRESMSHAVGLAVLLIGIKGAVKSDDLLLVVLSVVIGALIGETLKLEALLERLGKLIERQFKNGQGRLTQGFVSASMLFCVGAMAIVGSLESGLAGNHQTLYAKSVLDGTVSIVLASAMGIGVVFSAVPVFLYQGLITLGASAVKPYMVTDVVLQISSVGGILIMAIGLNFLNITRIRIGNLLPAIFLPIVYHAVMQGGAIIH
jgi:uncharacterized membrane protein YqgA involved in biofilm formation